MASFRLATFVMALLPASMAIGQELTAREVIAKSLSSRRQISSYDIEVSFDYGEQETVDARPTRIHYFLDEDRIRVDHQASYLESQRFNGLKETHYWHHVVNFPDRSIDFSSRLHPGSHNSAVQIDLQPERTRKNYMLAMKSHDLRSLGYHPSGVTLGTHLETCVQRLAENEMDFCRERIDETDCFRVSVDLVTGVKCDFWFAPEFGYAPIRARGTFEKYEMTDEIRLELKPWRDPDLWFPVSYHSTRKMGNYFQEEENAIIRVNSINLPLASSTFELNGLEVPEGCSVRIQPTNNKKLKWDGMEIVPASEVAQGQ